MLKAVIIEDTMLQMEMLRDIVSDFPFVKITACAASASEGVTLITETKPDFIFLDVDLPDKTGFEMLHELKDHSFDVIFTTAHEKYALVAHQYDSISFLIKPVTRESLEEALDRLQRKRKNQYAAEQMHEVLNKLMSNYNGPRKIAVPTIKAINYVDVDDLLRLEADGNYTTIYFVKGQSMVASKQIGEFERQLEPGRFFRVHDKHLINLQLVKSFIKGDSGTVVMNDGSTIPVSRRRKDDFLKSLDIFS